MTSRLSTLLVFFLALAFTGCADGAMTDLTGPAADAPAASAVTADAGDSVNAKGSSFCPSSKVSVSGHSTLEPNATGTYTASMKPGCTINNVSWTVSGTYASRSNLGNTLYVTAGAHGTSFTVTANVTYNTDNLSSGSLTVTVQNPPPPPPTQLNVTLANQGLGLRVNWTYSNPNLDYYKVTRSRKNLATGVVYANEYFYTGSSYYQDNDYSLVSNGNWYITYSVDAIDMNGDVIAYGGNAGRADLPY